MKIFDLKGRVALVTGAASGIGKEAAIALGTAGASLALVDVDEEGLETAADSVRDFVERVSISVADVSEEADVQAAVDAAIDHHGAIDVLVTSAGIARRSPAESMSLDTWRRVIDVNLTGTFLFDRDVGVHMLEHNSGSIIHIASVAGQVGLTTGNANYSASKGGLIALTKQLAVEWADRGVRVNAIAPTHFRTPLVEAAMEADPAVEAYFLENIPLGRLGEPSDIWGAVVYLASDASAMVTGHVLNVDGGHTAK